MIAVIFEVKPDPEHRDAYLAAAGRMRALAEKIDGFISVERFESLTEPGKLLSLSVWRDEAAVEQWRKLPEHRAMQKIGRERYFEDYRLRIADVVRDYGKSERDEAPADSRVANP
ncbi:MAG: antibiotic biosynthesis monooxygenase [Burkholderiales bacterium]